MNETMLKVHCQPRCKRDCGLLQGHTADEAVIAVGADVPPGVLCPVAAVPRQLDHSCTPVHKAPLSMFPWGDGGGGGKIREGSRHVTE